MKKLLSALGLVSLMFFTTASDGLVAHYKLDEGEGTVAKDSSGNGLDAALEGTRWEKFGVSGTAVRLDPDREKGCIRLPLSEKLMLDKAMTLSVYLKLGPEKFERFALFNLGTGSTGWTSYVAKSALSFVSPGQEGDGADKLNGGRIRVKIAPGLDSLTPFRNVVITVGPEPAAPGRNVVSFYLDGKKCSAKGVDGFPLRAPIRTSREKPITIGLAAGEGHWFNGILDEIKIYDRVLSEEEIRDDYRKTIAAVTTDEDPGEALPARPETSELPPLKNRRVALYRPLNLTREQMERAAKDSEGEDSPRHISGWPKPVRSVEWFKKEAEKLGCTVTVIDDEKLSDREYLTKKNFDTLILPAGVMPFEAEDSIFEYLVSGGNLVIPTVLPDVYKRYADGTFGKFRGKGILKNHTYGWYAPFLIRYNHSRHASRLWTGPLGLDPAVAAVIPEEILPSSVRNPDPKRPVRYRPVNNWSKIRGADACYGDGINYPLATDIQTDLYRERTGIGSGFTIYRYYNNLIFGSTLATFGPVGNVLIKGKDGGKYFEAVLRLLESKLPGEQEKEYYTTAVTLHREWSEFGFHYTAAIAALRDAALFSYLRGADWKGFAEKLATVEKEFTILSGKRKAQQNLLVAGNHAEAFKAGTALLAEVRETQKKFDALTEEAKEAVKDAKAPEKVPVKHKYGTVPSIASTVMPVNLSLLRRRLFDGIRRIGANVYSGSCDTWYAEDPLVQAQFKGILRDHKFIYPAGPRVLVRGGKFNPANGTVKDAPALPYPAEKISRIVKDLFELWKWKGDEQFRIGTCDETGLGLNFWGTQAKEALQKHLKEYYKGDIAAMNAHCGTSYKSFDEVQVPVRKPETPAQHAVWEHFNRCREAYLEFIYGSFYRIVKKHNPEIDVFAMPSTGGTQLPLFGLNYYNASKHMDVCGIDGTCGAISREWIYLDLPGKRYHTSEWGELYRESPLSSVHGQMWQELSGGTLGLEQHVWSSGNDSVGFVDFVSCPTAYGAILHMALKDIRKLDHLILDGKRVVPEVGILYSQTSRIHDQGWGWAGGSTLSRHMLSVTQYYSHFLSFGRSARVYAAEALLEGKMPPVKILIVPQAEFLSEAVQKALLNYARNGGQLILEGQAGKFDEFGRDSYRIFRETGVIPAFIGAESAVMEKAKLAIQKDDPAYSPSGKGKVLAAYDKENPAILTVPCGSGSVTFLGIGLGGCKYSCFAPVLERVMRSLGVNARFKVSDDSVVLREWEHGDDTYLFLSSKNADWSVKEITIRFRGKAGVEDYLFGKKVATDFRDGYTSFRTLMANGGRVFRLKGKIAPAGTPEDPPDFELAGSAGAKDDAKEFALPFQGNLYADTPMKTGDYTFSAVILGSGDNSKQGNAFLTVTGNGEVQKKRLEEGKTIYFRMRNRIFEVKCLRNFFMYPFYTVLEIREAAALPASSGASAVQNGDEVTLSNDLLSVTFSRNGAKMISFLPLAEKEDIVKARKAVISAGKAPGPFHNVDFLVRAARNETGATADFSLASPVAGKKITQEATLLPDAACCKLRFVCTNTSAETASFGLRYRPGLQLGGAADIGDSFFIQRKDGTVQRMAFLGRNKGLAFPDCGDFAAVTDTQAKVSWITLLPGGNSGESFYIWESSDFYNLEVLSPVKTVAPGESVKLDMTILYMHGLTGVDAVSGLNAAHLVVPAVTDQKKSLLPVLEIATADNTPSPVSVQAGLYKDGKKVAEFAPAEGEIAFDLPGVFTLKTVKNPDEFEDGAYTVKAEIRSAGGGLVCEKKVIFAGTAMKKLQEESRALAKELDEKSSSLSPEKRFALLVELGELKRALCTNDLPAAEKRADELKRKIREAR